MKIIYIHHSSFYVETENFCLLFDYFKGALPEIPESKPLYIFASHSHSDHFSREIFRFADTHKACAFLLSSDIGEDAVPEGAREKTVFLDAGEKRSFGGLTVEAFRSTDEGAAFWCTADGKEIYHAGDLNHWYWEGEEEAWNRDMTAAYRREIGKMAGRTADAAFLPLDPRLGQWFYLGIDDFMRTADAKAVFPMHFWGQFDVAGRLKALPCSEPYREKIMEISREGQEFEL